MNSTLTDVPDVGSTPVQDLPTVYKTYTATDFLIGLFICLGASVANAAGVAITKLDHTRNEKIPPAQRRRDWLRPLWLLGLGLYVISQLVGSTLALEYMEAAYVAPLGSTSLIFNVIFTKIFIGTSITRMDIAGTLVIILGVCGIVGFGNLRVSTAQDVENNLNLETIKGLWARWGWILYFVALELVTLLAFRMSSIIGRVWTEREALENEADPDARLSSARAPTNETFLQKADRWGRMIRFGIKQGIERWTVSKPDIVLRKLSGVAWATTGGLLAGQTLVFAKSAVKLISSSGGTEGNQLAHPLSIFIVLLLIVAAVAQIYCLNKGLKVYESTLVVPLFFATYTASGFLNSLTYLDQYDNFKDWVFAMIWLSILVLILGVAVLSSKKPEVPVKQQADFGEDEEEMVGGPRKPGEEEDSIETFSMPTLNRQGRKAEQQQGRSGFNDDENGWSMAKDSLDSGRSSISDDGDTKDRLQRPKLDGRNGKDDEFGSFVGEHSPILYDQEREEKAERGRLSSE